MARPAKQAANPEILPGRYLSDGAGMRIAASRGLYSCLLQVVANATVYAQPVCAMECSHRDPKGQPEGLFIKMPVK